MNSNTAALDSQQQQVERLQSEVEALRSQLRGAQRLATLGTMTAMVAHEFNNILTPIINYAQLARKNPQLVEKALSRASDGGARAATICRALLGASRAESDGPQPVRLAELLTDTLDAMARPLSKDLIELEIDVPPDLKVTTLRAELQQILLNLLINAREAAIAGNGPRWVRVTAQRELDRTLLSVADGGVGIEPENLELIFQPFFTTKTDEDSPRMGHGLGLAFCRNVLDTLGGNISVESQPGAGATFTISLPD